MDHDIIPSLRRAALHVFAAVILFGLYERGLTDLDGKLPADALMALRVVSTVPMFFALSFGVAILSGRSPSRLCLDPRGLDRVIWMRAFIMLVYQAGIAVALAKGAAQSCVYPFFLMHPLWQILARKLIRKKWAVSLDQVPGFLAIFAGVAVYAWGKGAFLTGTKSIDHAFLICQAAALVAGALFAFYNEYGDSITDGTRNQMLSDDGVDGGQKMTSLEASTYTNLAGLWLLVPTLVVLIPLMNVFGLDTSVMILAPGRGFPDASRLLELLGSFVLVVFGAWSFAEGLKRAPKNKKAQVAALDVLILPIGLIFDHFLSTRTTSPEDLSWPDVIATVLIVGGALWSSRNKKKRRYGDRTTGLGFDAEAEADAEGA